MLNFFLIIIASFSLYAYELPSLKLENSSNPEIVFFTQESVLVKEKLSYILKWKTLNTTEVKLTYIGSVSLSGELTITEDEYNMGAITLSASNNTSSKIDKVTINQVNKDLPPPPVFDKPEESQDYYNSTPYRNYPRRINPARRRYY
ncbi:hypothetical protein JHD49_06650 [Sulfurimonas sp. SAG-AH-194-C21]|nr:hypothetical protein [Sulfurimonas sp. SAG-AH-194-C21]MDF1883613.1 hypothetical protein [Sulfurimonas sp. SAG-AH-194-C21]